MQHLQCENSEESSETNTRKTSRIHIRGACRLSRRTGSRGRRTGSCSLCQWLLELGFLVSIWHYLPAEAVGLAEPVAAEPEAPALTEEA
jgi:hypothetical protein